MSSKPIQIKLFYSYSHGDETLRKKLDEHLAFLKQDNLIAWYDRELFAGQELKEEIKKELDAADIILLLISSRFLSSFYCYEIEMKRAMERHNAKEAIVVPVLLSDCIWENAPFAKLLLGPTDAKAIDNPKNWNTIDEALTDVARNIAKAVEFIKGKRANLSNQHDFISKGKTPRTSNLNDFPKPDNLLFTGREEEMKDFKKSLDNSRMFAIEGLGGQGKTEFASKCIEEFVMDKNRVLWLNGTAESKFDAFVESAGYGDVLKGENKTTQEIYSGFKDLIERDERIIVWDNYQTITDLDFNDFVSFANKYLTRSTIIFIAKQELYVNGAPIRSILIKGLEEKSFEYAKKLKQSEARFSYIPDRNLEKLCEYTLGHPLAIKLAMSLLSKGMDVDSLVTKITEYKGKGVKEVEELTKRIFDQVFEHTSTSIEERELLQKFSVFKTKVTREAIQSVYQKGDAFIPLLGLLDKFFINTDGNNYELHPIIRELSYKLLIDKESTHSIAAGYYFNLRSNMLNPALEEQIYYHLSKSNQWARMEREIEERGRKYIRIGQMGLVREMIENLKNVGIEKPIFHMFYGDIAQVHGNWEEARTQFEIASNQDADLLVKVEGTTKAGEMLFRKGNVKASLNLFEEAYVFCKEKGYKREEARALNDIGLVYKVLGKWNLEEQKLNEAFAISKELNDLEQMADASINIAVLYAAQGKFAEAMEKAVQGLNIYEQMDDKNGIALCLGNIGGIFREQGKYSEALHFNERSLGMYTQIGNKGGMATTLDSIGTIFNDQGKYNEALENYVESLKIKKEIGDKNGIAASLSNTAIVYQKQGMSSEALEHERQSLEIIEEIGDKRSTATILGNIGSLFCAQGKYDEALIKHEQELKISQELGDKKGMATALCYIGVVFQNQGKCIEALQKLEQGLAIYEEIGGKLGTAITCHNIAAVYANDSIKNYRNSINYFFRSYALHKQMEIKSSDALEWLKQIRDNKLGKAKFRILAKEVYKSMEEELKQYVPIQKLCQEEIKFKPPISRNALCPCGSGKQYKRCHGKS